MATRQPKSVTRAYRQKKNGVLESTYMLKIKGRLSPDAPMAWHARGTGVTFDPKHPKESEASANLLALLFDELRRDGSEPAWDFMNAVVRGDIRLRDLASLMADIDEYVTTLDGRRVRQSNLDRCTELLRRQRTQTPLFFLDKWAEDTAFKGGGLHGGEQSDPQKVRYVNHVRLVIEAKPAERDRFEWFLSTDNLKTAIEELRVTRGYKTKTLKKVRLAFGQFAKFLMARGVIHTNPVGEGRLKLKPTKTEEAAKAKVHRYTAGEAKALLFEYMGPEPRWEVGQEGVKEMRYGGRDGFEAWRATVALAFGAGAELSAMARLTKRDFLLDQGRVWMPGTKHTSRARWCHIIDWCLDVVRPYVESLPSPDSYFLPRAREGKSKTHTMNALTRHQRAACKALGIENRGFHKHRHGHAVYMLEQNPQIDRRVIKDQLGHTNNSTVLDTVYAVYTAQDRLDETAHLFRTNGATSPLRERVSTSQIDAIIGAER